MRLGLRFIHEHRCEANWVGRVPAVETIDRWEAALTGGEPVMRLESIGPPEVQGVVQVKINVERLVRLQRMIRGIELALNYNTNAQTQGLLQKAQSEIDDILTNTPSQVEVRP